MYGAAVMNTSLVCSIVTMPLHTPYYTQIIFYLFTYWGIKECQIRNSTTALVVLSLLGEGGLCPLWALAFL